MGKHQLLIISAASLKYKNSIKNLLNLKQYTGAVAIDYVDRLCYFEMFSNRFVNFLISIVFVFCNNHMPAK